MSAGLRARFVYNGSFWVYVPDGTVSSELLESDQFVETITALRGICPTPVLSGTFPARGELSAITLSGQIATPEPVEFGVVETGALRRVAVAMSSSSEVTINRISMRGGRRFAITDPSGCVGSRISRETTCSFNVIFEAPSETGRSFEDTVTIETTGGNVEDVVRGST